MKPIGRPRSVYEVYVKEESSGLDSRNDAPGVSGLSSTADQQLIQVINRYGSFTDENDPLSCDTVFKADCMDTDTAVDSDVINIDSTVAKLLGKDALRYKVSAQWGILNICRTISAKVVCREIGGRRRISLQQQFAWNISPNAAAAGAPFIWPLSS